MQKSNLNFWMLWLLLIAFCFFVCVCLSLIPQKAFESFSSGNISLSLNHIMSESLAFRQARKPDLEVSFWGSALGESSVFSRSKHFSSSWKFLGCPHSQAFPAWHRNSLPHSQLEHSGEWKKLFVIFPFWKIRVSQMPRIANLLSCLSPHLARGTI